MRTRWAARLAAAGLSLALCIASASVRGPAGPGPGGAGGPGRRISAACIRTGGWTVAKTAPILAVSGRYRVCRVCLQVPYDRFSFPVGILPGAALLSALLLVFANRRAARLPTARRPARVAKDYYRTGDLCFSEVFGNGVYRWEGATVQNPLGADGGTGYSPLLENIVTGERFFAKRLHCDSSGVRRYRRAVLNPPDRRVILWPSDVVSLTDKQWQSCTLSVGRPADTGAGSPGERYAVLFPCDGYPALHSGARRLAGAGGRNWRNPAVRHMAVQLVTAIQRLNADGYLYLDFDLSHFLFDGDGGVLLGFTGLAFRMRDLKGPWLRGDLDFSPDGLPPEFALPAVMRGMQKAPDIQTQNYSLCAMLFYLFFGRHAYEGRLMDGYSEANAQQYAIKYREYHKMPVFIFDPEDDQNALGAFDEEQRVITLWEQCPAVLREMFVRTLRRSNAEREHTPDDPSPAQWLSCFHDLGWDRPDS